MTNWTNDEIDYLLDNLLLDDFPENQWNLKCRLASVVFDRSIDSIQTLIRKISIRYPTPEYKPYSRKKRSGPFFWLDKYIIKLADEWNKTGAKYDPPPDDSYLAAVLARSVNDLKVYREQQRAKGRTSLKVFE